MKVGASTIEITPSANIEMSGYLARVQPAEGVHDPLAVRALFLDDGSNRLLWLHADLLTFDYQFVLSLKKKLSAQFGLQPDQILASATHTHSGPPAMSMINAGTADADYLEFLEAQVIAASTAAVEQAEEAETLYAEGTCALTADRRGQASAHTDSRMAILAWRRNDGSYIAVLSNYPVHNVAMAPENRLFSADMAGVAAKTISTKLNGNPTVLFTNGACGNLNPEGISHDFHRNLPYPNDFDLMIKWGDQMAESAIAALASAEPVADAGIATASETVGVELDALSLDEIAELVPRLRDMMAGRTGYVADRYRDAVDIWAQRMSELLRTTDAANRQAISQLPVELQIIRIAHIWFVCMNVEVFSVIADELRAATSQTVYVVGYANGDLGYLAPLSAHSEGGYETQSSFVFYATFPIKRGAFEQVRDRAAEMIKCTTQDE